jgi:Major Facilitator Superfamily
MTFKGVLGDIWPSSQRGIAILAYSMSVVGGPMFSPIAGAALVHSRLGWRWTNYITGIVMLAILTLDVIVLEESYANVLLVSKARKMRQETGDWAFHARHEEDVKLDELVHKFLLRPLQLLTTPICFLIVLYVSFVYGIVFM